MEIFEIKLLYSIIAMSTIFDDGKDSGGRGISRARRFLSPVAALHFAAKNLSSTSRSGICDKKAFTTEGKIGGSEDSFAPRKFRADTFRDMHGTLLEFVSVSVCLRGLEIFFK